MAETITAIYEKGVLRPLTPMTLPERTRVQLQIVVQLPIDEERQQVGQALLNAGLIRPQPESESVEPVPDAELTEAAERLAAAGSLSELILAERNNR